MKNDHLIRIRLYKILFYEMRFKGKNFHGYYILLTIDTSNIHILGLLTPTKEVFETHSRKFIRYLTFELKLVKYLSAWKEENPIQMTGLSSNFAPDT